MENFELTVSELARLEPDSYVLADIRGETAFSYGHIPGAAPMPEWELFAEHPEWKGKKLVVYCQKGEQSLGAVQRLQERGIEAQSLKGGYLGWLISSAGERQMNEDYYKDVEQSLRKKFRKDIWCNFTKAVREYELVNEGDRIAVCISGGKDSMLMAKLFQELKRHNKVSFDLVFLVMNPGYSEGNMEIIRQNAKNLHIPITVFESDIFESVFQVEKSPCYLCARMRRGYLYSKAKELGCNKIALGHHYDDVIETILMGMLYGGQVQTMMPKLHSTNFEGMELIRPLYLVREDRIKAWRDYNGLGFIQCACKFTDTCSTCNPDGANASKRMDVKQLIREMKKTNPFVESNIFRSVENVNLSTVVAYKKDGVKHHFLETYDRAAETEFAETQKAGADEQ
ncbi:MAG: ATP-binding protein [Eubacteriales bacterium]|nr:ATP-binding protein [Eubacteriales bacterium]